MTDTRTNAGDDLRSSRLRRGLVPAAALCTGAAGALTLILTQHYLDLDEFAPVAQLWTIWAVLAAGLTFSFQQWAAIYDVDRATILPRHEHRRVLFALVAVGALIFVVTYSTRERLFHSPALVWPIAAALLPTGTAYNGIRRGQLARRRHQVGLAAVIFGENAIRLLVSVALIAAAAPPSWFALAMLAGFLVVLGPTGSTPASVAADDGGTSGLEALSASAAAGFLAYAFMFGSPILLTVAGATAAEVSALFLVLTGVRLPFVVLQAVVPQLAASLASAPDRPRSIQRVRTILAVIAVSGSVIVGIGGYALGNLVIGTIFGIRGEIDPATYGLLAAASLLSACALVATVILVVEGRTRRIVVAWSLPALSAVVVTATGLVADPSALALWLFLAQATVATVALFPVRSSARRRHRRDHEPIA